MKQHDLLPSRRLFIRVLSSACIATGLITPAVYAADTLAVTTSFSILGDLVKVVGKERVTVSTLVGPNQDAHVFEPKPSDAKAIQNSKLLVINGLGFEPWANKLAKAANFKGTTVFASKGIRPLGSTEHKGHAHHHDDADPHAWQNPLNVIQYVTNISNALTALDPAGAAIYQSNAQAYIKEVQALDNWIESQFSGIATEKRKVITSHDAFAYFAARYKIKFVAAQGTSTEAEPSAKQIAKLVQQIKREKVKTVFVENMSNPKLLEQISKDAGASVGAHLYADALSAAGQPGATYLQMMRHNVSQMAASMQ